MSIGPKVLPGLFNNRPPPAVPKVQKRKTRPQASIKAGKADIAAFMSVFF